MKKVILYIVLMSILFTGCSTTNSKNILALEKQNKYLYDNLKFSTTRIIIDKTSPNYNQFIKENIKPPKDKTISSKVLTKCQVYVKLIWEVKDSSIEKFKNCIDHDKVTNIDIGALNHNGINIVYFKENGVYGSFLVANLPNFYYQGKFYRNFLINKNGILEVNDKTAEYFVDVKASYQSDDLYDTVKKLEKDSISNMMNLLDKYNIKYQIVQ